MKVIIAGSRTLTNVVKVCKLIEEAIIENSIDITEIVCGMASGVDRVGQAWALKHNIKVAEFPADWNTYGKSAGPIRNKQMADYADAAIVIWDGQSRGSKNMIETMKRLGKPTYEKSYHLV